MTPFVRKFALFALAYVAVARGVTIWIQSLPITVDTPVSLDVQATLPEACPDLVPV